MVAGKVATFNASASINPHFIWPSSSSSSESNIKVTFLQCLERVAAAGYRDCLDLHLVAFRARYSGFLWQLRTSPRLVHQFFLSSVSALSAIRGTFSSSIRHTHFPGWSCVTSLLRTLPGAMGPPACMDFNSCCFICFSRP